MDATVEGLFVEPHAATAGPSLPAEPATTDIGLRRAPSAMASSSRAFRRRWSSTAAAFVALILE